MTTENPNVTVLNDFSGTRVESRTRASGKQHVTISFSSTPILVHHDPLSLGKPVADAIAEAIRSGIRAISEVASKGTLAKRETAARAYARGEAWARKAYSGGRMGAMPPNQSSMAFNDSGRLAAGVTVNANKKEGGWTVNAAANRLLPSAFKDLATFQRMMQRLVELVPALENPLAHKDVVAAVSKTWRDMHQVQAMAAAEKQSALVGRAVVGVLRFAARLVA